MLNKKALTGKALTSLLLWIVFIALALAIIYFVFFRITGTT